MAGRGRGTEEGLGRDIEDERNIPIDAVTEDA